MLDLIIDIETHRVKEAGEMTPELQKAWKDRYVDKFKDEYNGNNIQAYKEKSALFPEFSRIICICIGFEYQSKFYTQSFSGPDEVNNVLIPFVNRINDLSNKNAGIRLIGWNINGFDKPFIIKRLIINKIQIPSSLMTFNMKPWDVKDIDLMQVWKFGSQTSTPLEAAAASLGIPSKSESFDGKSLFKISINDMNWLELVQYCKEDVSVTYAIYKFLENYLPK